MKLVDTSSWIEYLRGRNNAVADRVRDLMREDEAALCEMTLVELEHCDEHFASIMAGWGSAG